MPLLVRGRANGRIRTAVSAEHRHQTGDDASGRNGAGGQTADDHFRNAACARELGGEPTRPGSPRPSGASTTQLRRGLIETRLSDKAITDRPDRVANPIPKGSRCRRLCDRSRKGRRGATIERDKLASVPAGYRVSIEQAPSPSALPRARGTGNDLSEQLALKLFKPIGIQCLLDACERTLQPPVVLLSSQPQSSATLAGLQPIDKARSVDDLLLWGQPLRRLDRSSQLRSEGNVLDDIHPRISRCVYLDTRRT
jgi:hypothetical protein